MGNDIMMPENIGAVTDMAHQMNLAKLEALGAAALAIIVKLLILWVLYMIIKKICFVILDKWAEKANKLNELKNKTNGKINPELAVARIATILGIFKSLTGFILAFVAVIMALGVFGLNIAPLLATAGVAGLAIGFGAQKIVKDVVTGVLILAENQYAVGERITTCGFSGEVTELGIRTTTIKGDDGEMYIISNGDISTVTNFSRNN